jgi:hypothetical protein
MYQIITPEKSSYVRILMRSPLWNYSYYDIMGKKDNWNQSKRQGNYLCFE